MLELLRKLSFMAGFAFSGISGGLKDTGSIDIKATCFARGKQKSGVVLDR